MKPAITTKHFHTPPVKPSADASRDVQLWEKIDAGSRFANRRSVPRYPFSGAAAVTEPISATRLAALVSEISAKGCYLESLDELGKNAFIQISIVRNGITFETWGRIAYVQAGIGSGVAFFETAAAQQRILDDWIAEISAFLR